MKTIFAIFMCMRGTACQLAVNQVFPTRKSCEAAILWQFASPDPNFPHAKPGHLDSRGRLLMSVARGGQSALYAQCLSRKVQTWSAP